MDLRAFVISFMKMFRALVLGFMNTFRTFLYSSMNALLGLIFVAASVLWVYNDAKKRGMNALLYAVLTFVFFIFGLLFYVFMRRKYPLTRARNI
jgi:uncharacterized membrane protein